MPDGSGGRIGGLAMKDVARFEFPASIDARAIGFATQKIAEMAAQAK